MSVTRGEKLTAGDANTIHRTCICGCEVTYLVGRLDKGIDFSDDNVKDSPG